MSIFTSIFGGGGGGNSKPPPGSAVGPNGQVSGKISGRAHVTGTDGALRDVETLNDRLRCAQLRREQA